MLDNQTRGAIQGLFGKLSQVERQGPERDAEAENLINSHVGRQPGAPYYMAQTIIVQEQALEDAQRRIEELESRSAAPSGLRSIFGSPRQSVPAARPNTGSDAGPWSQGPTPAGRGGGFLAGAAQTAMGVAGGVLLGNALAGMFGGDEAQAATPAAASGDENPPSAEPETDDGGGFFGGMFGGDEE